MAVAFHQGAIEVTSAKSVCHVLDQPGQLLRVTSNGSVGVPVNWKGLPGHEVVPFDTAFPFVANAPQIDPVPVMERAVIVDGTVPRRPTEGLLKYKFGKSRSADDDDAKPKKRKASNNNSGPSAPTRAKTVRRSNSGDDDASGGENGIGGMGIIIGGGMGGFRGGHYGGHGR